MDIKTTKIDDRGRITIPIEFRQFFPDSSEVTWRFDGKKLIVNLEGNEQIEFLTMEFLMNQISEVKSEVSKLGFQIGEIRKMVFTELVKPPEDELRGILEL